jgi:hypothetical protein
LFYFGVVGEYLMNNKCVYVHKLNGEVVYVGSGGKQRSYDRTGRSEEHLSVWGDIQIEILHENLSIAESTRLEQDLINTHWRCNKLFNKRKLVYVPKKLNYNELNEFLYYDESSPTYLRWKVDKRCVKANGVAGGTGSHGYTQLCFNGKNYRGHRVIWVLCNKVDIEDGLVIDHIDGNKLNNKISNLRSVSPSDNQRNKKHKQSNTGFQGISENLNGKCFQVSFSNPKTIAEYFSYTDKPNKRSKNHYPIREQALAAALAYRDTLVNQGRIILTSKESNASPT